MPAHRVIAAVLLRRIVHRKDNQLRRPIAVQVGDRDSGSLVFPELPIRDGDPGSPRCHCAVSIQRTAAVVALVAPSRPVHHQDNEVENAVAIHIRNRDIGAGIEPRKPVRNRQPRRPAGDPTGCVDIPANPVVTSVLTVRGVDPEDEQVRLLPLMSAMATPAPSLNEDSQSGTGDQAVP